MSQLIDENGLPIIDSEGLPMEDTVENRAKLGVKEASQDSTIGKNFVEGAISGTGFPQAMNLVSKDIPRAYKYVANIVEGKHNEPVDWDKVAEGMGDIGSTAMLPITGITGAIVGAGSGGVMQATPINDILRNASKYIENVPSESYSGKALGKFMLSNKNDLVNRTGGTKPDGIFLKNYLEYINANRKQIINDVKQYKTKELQEGKYQGKVGQQALAASASAAFDLIPFLLQKKKNEVPGIEPNVVGMQNKQFAKIIPEGMSEKPAASYRQDIINEINRQKQITGEQIGQFKQGSVPIPSKPVTNIELYNNRFPNLKGKMEFPTVENSLSSNLLENYNKNYNGMGDSGRKLMEKLIEESSNIKNTQDLFNLMSRHQENFRQVFPAENKPGKATDNAIREAYTSMSEYGKAFGSMDVLKNYKGKDFNPDLFQKEWLDKFESISDLNKQYSDIKDLYPESMVDRRGNVKSNIVDEITKTTKNLEEYSKISPEIKVKIKDGMLKELQNASTDAYGKFNPDKFIKFLSDIKKENLPDESMKNILGDSTWNEVVNLKNDVIKNKDIYGRGGEALKQHIANTFGTGVTGFISPFLKGVIFGFGNDNLTKFDKRLTPSKSIVDGIIRQALPAERDEEMLKSFSNMTKNLNKERGK